MARYKEREEWKDIVPIPQVSQEVMGARLNEYVRQFCFQYFMQRNGREESLSEDDGPNPVVSIQYTAEFRETMDYFRAILQKNELSSRALDLTEHVIDLNAGNYTVWAFRRAVIEAIARDWKEELSWVTALAEKYPKNYQIWQHRRFCLEKILLQGSQEEGAAEIEFLNTYLNDEDLDDAKNYHAWAHRQWVVRTFNLWQGEIAVIDFLLANDVRNNSAWNHRFYVISSTTDLSLPVRKAEVLWALQHAALAPHNESAWSFIRGMIGSQRVEPSSCGSSLAAASSSSVADAHTHTHTHPHIAADFPELVHEIEAHCQSERPPPACMELLADILLQRGDKEAVGEAVKVYQKLAAEIDVIRAKYWKWRAQVAEDLQKEKD